MHGCSYHYLRKLLRGMSFLDHPRIISLQVELVILKLLGQQILEQLSMNQHQRLLFVGKRIEQILNSQNH